MTTIESIQQHSFIPFLQDMFSFKLLAAFFGPLLGIVILFDVTGLVEIIKKYVFSDVSYLVWLVEAMVIDLVTGITKVWVRDGIKAVTSKGLRDTVSKVIQYGSFVIISHLLVNFQVDGKPPHSELIYLQRIAFEFLIFIEIKSVYENIVAINPQLDFVKKILESLKKFVKKDKEK